MMNLSLGFPAGMGILLIVSLLASIIGYYKYVYFLSIGYGFAVAAQGITMLIYYHDELSAGMILLSLLLVCYGIRLSGFLAVREFKSISYRKTLKDVTKTEKPMPFGVKTVIWISVSVLYVTQVSPIYYRYSNHMEEESTAVIIGILIMIAGLLLESLADYQKSAQKKINPKVPATKGLYSIVRCPNYFGEIVFWTGVFVSGCDILNGWLQAVIALTGYVCIVAIMFNGAQRLEKRQNKSYGANPDYQKYADSTPILIPFLPLYHLVREAEEKGA